jgi:hypothetical protein
MLLNTIVGKTKVKSSNPSKCNIIIVSTHENSCKRIRIVANPLNK